MNFSENNLFLLKIAGNCYSVNLHSQYTKNYLKEYIIADSVEPGPKTAEVSEKAYQENYKYLQNINPDIEIIPAYNEYQTLALPVYSLVIDSGVIPLHGLSFVPAGYNEAVILSAPSGTGKTTQYLNWKAINSEGLTIINGDNSLINTCSSDFTVYSSPWAGKENYHSDLSGSLNSIICLEQGKQNFITEMSQLEKIAFLLPQILVQSNSKKDVDNICSSLTSLIRSVNIVKFINDGTINSTQILKDYIYERLEK